ncbi:hypothetical protein [Bacillus sp. MZGC1]|uniref:hypothetical protein n=1 Tax=Bacillus sp. MZGC1 TaxID=2108543 RepID=UPI000D0450FD|nr:hypothetical protein [Bacillus sp. MZGC1]PRS48143.1 hypothetical protein C6Y06_17960 [Bacillus sp. MZGC1]
MYQRLNELEKSKYKLKSDILEKKRDLLHIKTNQNPLALERLFELSEVLQLTEESEWVSSSMALKAARINKEFLKLFDFKGDGKAYINKEEFSRLHEDFIRIKFEQNNI